MKKIGTRIPFSRSGTNRRDPDGSSKSLSKLTALIILFALSLLEFVLGVNVAIYGPRGVSLLTWLSFLCLIPPIVSMIFYILFYNKDKTQKEGWMEVATYLNVNNMGKKDQ